MGSGHAHIGTDDVDQARKEAAEFIALKTDFDWRLLRPLSEIARAGGVARSETDLTLYKSLGSGPIKRIPKRTLI